MSAEITYKCDFCRKEITSNSINHDHAGHCKNKSMDERWTTNLRGNINGPHICYICSQGLNEAGLQMDR